MGTDWAMEVIIMTDKGTWEWRHLVEGGPHLAAAVIACRACRRVRLHLTARVNDCWFCTEPVAHPR